MSPTVQSWPTCAYDNIVLGGHVEVGDFVVLGGCAGAHQFLRIGSYAMVGGYVPLRKDVLPYSMVGGEPVRHYRLNSIGLRRGGFDKERYRAVEAAFRALREGNGDLPASQSRNLCTSSVSGTPVRSLLPSRNALKAASTAR